MQLLLKIIVLFFLIKAPCLEGALEDPPILFLHLTKDSSKELVLVWMTPLEHPENEVYYKKKGENTPLMIIKGSSEQAPNHTPLWIHKVKFTSLEQKGEYEFSFLPFFEHAKKFSFKTLPNHLENPLSFAVGGDIYHDKLESVQQIFQILREKNPHFVVLGGDIAYTSRKFSILKEKFERWGTFLKLWKESMVTEDGYMIPMLAVIGNHDVNGRFGMEPKDAPFFYSLFREKGDLAYGSYSLGDALSFFILDSNHTAEVAGIQTEWLKKELELKKESKARFTAYHVPAYPSVRSFKNEVSAAIRENFVPLFEKHAILFAFEHHDHAYKRTFPLIKGEKQEKGVIFLGDGAMGITDPRTPDSLKNRPYLAKALPVRHFFFMEVNKEKTFMNAIDFKKNTIDSVVINNNN